MTSSAEAAPQAWEPGSYLKFADLRVRPGLDLLAQVPLDAPGRVTDLGCGAGSITPFLRTRWPDADITALDGSTEMLARAQAEYPNLGVTWQCADIRTWAPSEPQDLIYSNAVLHWIDDHATLLPRLMGELASGGVLAVQLPNQFAEASHMLMRDVAHSGPWAETLEPLLRCEPVSDMGAYYDWLSPHTVKLDIWETTYMHMLEGDDPVLDWIGSTALKPLLEALNDGMRAAYRTALADELRSAYPKCADGKTLFPFCRLFMIAQKG